MSVGLVNQMTHQSQFSYSILDIGQKSVYTDFCPISIYRYRCRLHWSLNGRRKSGLYPRLKSYLSAEDAVSIFSDLANMAGTFYFTEENIHFVVKNCQCFYYFLFYKIKLLFLKFFLYINTLSK